MKYLCLTLKDRDTVGDKVTTIVPALDADPVIAKPIKIIVCAQLSKSRAIHKWWRTNNIFSSVCSFVSILCVIWKKNSCFSDPKKLWKIHSCSTWILDSNNKKCGVNRKLLDSIGIIVEEDISWLLIESSGYSKKSKTINILLKIVLRTSRTAPMP